MSANGQRVDSEGCIPRDPCRHSITSNVSPLPSFGFLRRGAAAVAMETKKSLLKKTSSLTVECPRCTHVFSALSNRVSGKSLVKSKSRSQNPAVVTNALADDFHTLLLRAEQEVLPSSFSSKKHGELETSTHLVLQSSSLERATTTTASRKEEALV